MGILNVTPDSFSDGGRYLGAKDAVARADDLAEQGADIIDIGGESTRPGAAPVDADEEIRRVVPVIREIVRRRPKVPVSIDSCKASVADAAMGEGAAMINDISGLRDPAMLDVAARWNAPVVIMHMKGTPQTMQKRPVYRDVVGDIVAFFKERIHLCEKSGIEKIILDPGIGFGKTARHNLEILNRLDEITRLGYPVMVGASRKSFLGKTLGLPVEEREEGTLAAHTIAVMKGAAIIRAHDARKNLRAVRLAESVLKSAKP